MTDLSVSHKGGDLPVTWVKIGPGNSYCGEAEILYEVDGGGHCIEVDGAEFVVFESEDQAGQAARDYWQHLAENDPEELACIVGEKALIAWGLDREYAPGSIGVRSLSDWLDLWLGVPEEHFAVYDHEPRSIEAGDKLVEELGYTPEIAYRSN